MKKKHIRILSVILTAFFILTGIGLAFATNIGETITGLVEKMTNQGEQAEEQNDPFQEKLRRYEETVTQENESEIAKAKPKGSLSASGSAEAPVLAEAVQSQELESADILSEQVKQKIQSKNMKADKLKKGLNKIFSKKQFSERQKEKFNSYLTANDDTVTVSILYDYLYEHFFTYSDLDSAIARNNSGEALDTILTGFCDIEESFVPRAYQDGQLDYLIREKGIPHNQLAVIEILSHRGLLEFEPALERLCNGENFTDICEELQLLNTTAKMGAVNVSRNEINQCMTELQVTEEEAIRKISNAKKAKVKDSEVMNFLKSNGSKGERIRKYYTDILE